MFYSSTEPAGSETWPGTDVWPKVSPTCLAEDASPEGALSFPGDFDGTDDELQVRRRGAETWPTRRKPAAVESAWVMPLSPGRTRPGQRGWGRS
jgi:hypothetical protein